MEKLLSNPVRPHQISLCPSMDLVAVVTKTELDVFRFNGQRAFNSVRPETDCTIDSMSWLANGSGISIAWSDGIIDVIDSAHGRLAKRLPGRHPRKGAGCRKICNESNTSRVGNHSWAFNIIEPDVAIGENYAAQRSRFGHEKYAEDSSERFLTTHKQSTTLENYYERVPDPRLINTIAGLPGQLALICPDEELPHLDSLPRIDDSGVLDLARDEFATQASVEETLYQQSSSEVFRNASDVLVACWNDNIVSTTVDGLICEHSMPHLLPDVFEEIVGQGSHPFSSCHAILRSQQREPRNVSLDLLSLKGMQQTGHLFKLITSRTNSLKELSNYILHCVSAIRIAWKTGQELPKRFLSNVSGELDKRKHDLSIVAAFAHQAVTGTPFPEIKEWLSEELSERGYKRWDAAVTGGYLQVLELVHVHLLPALDYASTITSRLRGLSRTEPPLPLFNIQHRHLTRVMSELDNLRLIGNRVLEYANEELQSFRVFSTWLHLQVTIIRAEQNSTAANDAAEKAAAIDHGTLLSYIEGPLLHSQLNYILGRSSLEVTEARRRPGDQLKRWLLLRILEKHDKEAMQPKGQEDGGSVEAVNLLWQALMLRDSINEVVEVPRQGLEKTTTWSDKLVLELRAATMQTNARAGDIRMVVELPQKGLMCTYILEPTEGPYFYMHRILHYRHLENIDHNASQTKAIKLPPLESSMPGGPKSRLVALRLLTDDIMMALIYLPYEKAPLQLQWAYYGAAAGVEGIQIHDVTSQPPLKQWHPRWKEVKTWHFEEMGDFMPGLGSVELRLAVGQHIRGNLVLDSDRKHEPSKVVLCMLEEHGNRYRVEEFDLQLQDV